MNIDLNEILLQEEEQALRIEESILEMRKDFVAREAGAVFDKIENGSAVSKLENILEDSEFLLGVINEEATSKRIWQIIFACLAMVLVVGCFVCYNFYVSSENQMARLGEAKADVQTAGSELLQSEEKVKALETELVVSKGELERVTRELAVSKGELERVTEELAGSRSEVKAFMRELAESNAKADNLENQLANTSGRLKDLQDRNEQVVRKMKERLGQL